MAKGICPTCEALVDIHPTDEWIGWSGHLGFAKVPVGSARYWLVVLHVDTRVDQDEDGRRPFCSGSGKKV